jgi:hypothetical protein
MYERRYMNLSPQKTKEAPGYPTLSQLAGPVLATCAMVGVVLQPGCRAHVWTGGVVRCPSLDSDADGLLDEEERQIGTDPYHPDTDEDGTLDGKEVHVFKTDPLNSHSHPEKKSNKTLEATSQ